MQQQFFATFLFPLLQEGIQLEALQVCAAPQLSIAVKQINFMKPVNELRKSIEKKQNKVVKEKQTIKCKQFTIIIQLSEKSEI